MQILLITPAFPPFPGGGERYVRSLALALASQGHAITVVTSAATREQEFWQGTAVQTLTEFADAGLRVIACPLPGLGPRWAGQRRRLLAWRKLMVLWSMLPGEQTAVLQRMARLIPPISQLDAALARVPGPLDLVHGFNISWEHTLLAGQAFANRQRLPFVVTPFAHLGAGHSDRVARNSTMNHQKRLLRQADRVLTLTAVEQAGLAALGVPAERLAVIGGGLDPLPPLLETAVVQQQHSLPAQFALFVGRNSREKGAIHAAQAVLQLRHQGSQVALVLVGQPTAEFDRFYGRLSAEAREGVRPLGIVDDSSKHALLSLSDLLLLPSRTDSFGIVLLEAWAYGKPVIAARAGGIPGVIDEGQNGLLIPFGDVAALAAAIDQLWQQPALRQRLGQNGRQKVNSAYSWEQVATRTLAHYRQLVAVESGKWKVESGK